MRTTMKLVLFNSFIMTSQPFFARQVVERIILMNKYLLVLLLAFLSVSNSFAQYKEPEKKEKVDIYYPKGIFDSLQAKKMLARGTATIKGVAFTNANTLTKRIYANQIKVVLLPVTSYFEEWYQLRKDKENLRKRRYVYLSADSYKYRLEAITNSDGEFTFPEMKPGKYFLQAFLGWTYNGSYNEYTGSGYNSYGGQTNYYQPKNYSVDHTDRIEEFVELKENGQIVKVKLH